MAREDLLFEVGLEEMPARFMPPALTQLAELAAKELREARLDYGGLKTYGTPRRLALFVEGLASRQREYREKVRGPAQKVAYDAQGNPTPALLGFARGQGVEVAALWQEEVKGIPYIFATRVEAGQAALIVLPGMLENCLRKLTFAKTMRWGSGQLRFARPIRWLLALCGSQVLPLEFGGCRAGNTTWGHRFLSRGPLVIDEPRQYLSRLEQAWVIADQDQRRQLIRQQGAELAAAHGGNVRENKDLLEEVTHLVEYPTALFGSIPLRYMELPPEVLVTSMEVHQRYFPVTGSQGKLLPGFIALRDGGPDHLDTVRKGNEKVIRARLEDASFFWAEDKKTHLGDRRPLLDRVVYLEGLGSMGDKVLRLTHLVGWLADHLGEKAWVRARAQRAASLAKSDLVTYMVGEFPELQGTMGEKYALAAGEEAEVAWAIGQQYRPRYVGDSLPDTAEGILLALADKADNICGCFLAGLIPTGSQDPYALRRQAQAICNLALEKELPLSVPTLLGETYQLYARQFSLAKDQENLVAEIMDFFRQRLHYILSEAGTSYDVLEAVLAAGFDRPWEVGKRAQALTAFRREEDFSALLTAYTRAANLALKSDGLVKEENLGQPAEKELWAGVLLARQQIAASPGDYAAAFVALAKLRPLVDTFFTDLLVMVEDPEIRQTRLALLQAVVALMAGIADLSKIVQ